MNSSVKTIINSLQNINSGKPWFGRTVYNILDEVDENKVYIKPAYTAGKPDNTEHSLIELLYHMITWADFTLKRIEKDKVNDLAAAEELDWRVINPKVHTWKIGLVEFKKIHKKIIDLLRKKDDNFLKEKVDYRNYDFDFLLNGLIQHNIYHLGQIAYLNKMLS